MKVFFAILGFSLLIAACSSTQNLSKSMVINQGIRGIVTERTGNQMPSPDVPSSEGKPIKTTIYVYEQTHLNQVQRAGTAPLYDTILSKFVKSVESDENGMFEIDLPTGNYSLFTKVKGKYYANHFDDKNNIAPVTVKKNKVTEVNITVSASASF